VKRNFDAGACARLPDAPVRFQRNPTMSRDLEYRKPLMLQRIGPACRLLLIRSIATPAPRTLD